MSTTETIPYRFLVRGGTAANLAAVNEVPLKRELVVAIDTGRIKLGDGVTSYNALPYVAESPRMGYLTATFDAGDDVVEAGSFCDVFVPYGFRATRWTLLAGQAGDVSIDVRAAAYAAYPVSGSITAGTPPALTGAEKAQGSTLAGWATVDGPSTVRFIVTAAAGIRRVSLILEVDRQWEG